jgi:hypothetical protein
VCVCTHTTYNIQHTYVPEKVEPKKIAEQPSEFLFFDPRICHPLFVIGARRRHFMRPLQCCLVVQIFPSLVQYYKAQKLGNHMVSLVDMFVFAADL